MHCPLAGLIRQQSNASFLKRFRKTSFFAFALPFASQVCPQHHEVARSLSSGFDQAAGAG